MSNKYGGKVTAAGVGAAIADGFHHRSNFGKDKKPFKSRSRSQSVAKKGGKVERASIKSHGDIASQKRTDRVNHSKQLLKQKRVEAVAKKRVGSSQGPPRVVALIALGCSGVDLAAAHALLSGGCQPGSSIPTTNPLMSTIAFAYVCGGDVSSLHALPLPHVCTPSLNRLSNKAHRITLYQCPRDPLAILDIAKVADVLVFVVGAEVDSSPALSANGVVATDAFSKHIVTTVRGQGFPAALGVVQGLNKFDAKKITGARKAATEYVLLFFPLLCVRCLALFCKSLNWFVTHVCRALHGLVDDSLKVLSLDTPEDADQLRRFITNIKIKSLLPSLLHTLTQIHSTPPRTAARCNDDHAIGNLSESRSVTSIASDHTSPHLTTLTHHFLPAAIALLTPAFVALFLRRDVQWRDMRSYLLAENIAFAADAKTGVCAERDNFALRAMG
jgi:hypothetical protein